MNLPSDWFVSHLEDDIWPQRNLMMCVFIFHRAISHMMSALLYPLITFVLLLVCVAYWGATALYPLLFSIVCVYAHCQ